MLALERLCDNNCSSWPILRRSHYQNGQQVCFSLVSLVLVSNHLNSRNEILLDSLVHLFRPPFVFLVPSLYSASMGKPLGGVRHADVLIHWFKCSRQPVSCQEMSNDETRKVDFSFGSNPRATVGSRLCCRAQFLPS